MEVAQFLSQLKQTQAKAIVARKQGATLQTQTNQLLWACCPSGDEQAWRALSIQHMQFDHTLVQLEKDIGKIISAIEPKSVTVQVQSVAC